MKIEMKNTVMLNIVFNATYTTLFTIFVSSMDCEIPWWSILEAAMLFVIISLAIMYLVNLILKSRS